MIERWRFVIPNLLTCISIGFGLIAISRATAGAFDDACWWSLWCVLLDKADGTAARLLGSTSKFGMQLDSLSDLITFGIAPATIVLAALVGQQPVVDVEAAWPGYRHVVYGGAFLFAICAALRLAKFNVMSDEYGDRHFFGVPTTLSGALVCSYFLTARKYALPSPVLALLPVVMLVLAILMVSRIPLSKLVKRRSLAANLFQIANVVCVYGFGMMRIFPEYLLTVAAGYLLLGSLYATLAGVRPPPAPAR